MISGAQTVAEKYVKRMKVLKSMLNAQNVKHHSLIQLILFHDNTT